MYLSTAFTRSEIGLKVRQIEPAIRSSSPGADPCIGAFALCYYRAAKEERQTLALDVARFIRIERQMKSKWATIPLGEKVRVWDTSSAMSDDGEPRLLFHIGYLESVARGQRVKYLGQTFSILDVSDSKRLIGLELSCRGSPA
jgi:hypothetical protein